MIRRRRPSRRTADGRAARRFPPALRGRGAGALLAALAIAGAGFAAGSRPAPAQTAPSAGAPVIRVLEGAAAPDLSVAVNRALVVESSEAFAEVSVANPGIADVAALSNRSVYILGKQAGRTTLTLLGPNGRLIANIAVSVGPDLAEFKERLRDILPGERIQVRSAADGVVLSGNISSTVKLSRALELAERYAPGRVSNMMTVGGSQQVLLRVRFAEVQRQAAKELGFNWGASVASGNFLGLGESGDFLQGTNSAGNLVDGDSTTTYTAGGTPEGVFGLVLNAGGVLASVTVDALENKGYARTLAEPNLVALSGDTASFLAGGEYPIPVYGGDTGSIAVEYRPFGVSLGFTPTVIDGDLINLEMEAESSAIDSSITIQNQGIEFNGFSTRRAKTTIELKDGDSFAIAGLLQDDFRDNATQIPWVGDVPVLGTLFKSTGFQRSQTELVIIVTAYLVNPVKEDVISMPGERLRVPSERELFLFGKLEALRDPVARDVGARNFEGEYGYVLQ